MNQPNTLTTLHDQKKDNPQPSRFFRTAVMVICMVLSTHISALADLATSPRTLVFGGYDIYATTIVKEGTTWKQWYGGWATQADLPWDRMYYSVSTDSGATWATPIEIFTIPNVQVNDPSVLRLWDETAQQYYYIMYYTYYPSGLGDPTNYVAYSTSTDGISWTHHGVLIGADNGIDLEGAWAPSAISMDANGDVIHLYFFKNNFDGTVLRTTLTDQGTTFVPASTIAVMPPGPPRVNVDVSRTSDGTWWMFYNGVITASNGATTFNTRVMYSSDGVDWTESIHSPIQEFDNAATTTPHVVWNSDSSYDLWFGYGSTSFVDFQVFKQSFVREEEIYLFDIPGVAATASSEESAAFVAGNAIDGDKDSAWASSVYTDSVDHTEWLELDLGTSREIAGVRLTPRLVGGQAYRFPVDFKIQQSDTGSAWTDVPGASRTDITRKSPDDFQLVFAAPVNVRHLRFECTKLHDIGDGNYAVQLAEFAALEDVEEPTLVGTSPAAGSNLVPVSSDLKATFHEDIALTGTGTVTLRNLTLGPGEDLVINLPDSGVSEVGTVLTIDPLVDLDPATNYAVRISADAVVDLEAPANSFAGIADDTTWTFTTSSFGQVIVQDGFSGTFAAGNGAMAGRVPDTVNLPGNTYTEQQNANVGAKMELDTGTGIPGNGNSLKTGFNNSAHIQFSNFGPPSTPITLSLDLQINSIADDAAARGIGLGFWSPLPTLYPGTETSATTSFTGILVNPSGTLEFVLGGVSQGGFTTAPPAFSTSAFHNLSCTVDPATGSVLQLQFAGTDHTADFAASFPTANFTPSDTAGFLGSTGVDANNFGRVDNFIIATSSPTLISVPDVTGQPQATAEANLTAAGFTVGTVTTASSPSVPAGDVISQSPMGGASAPDGSAVDLVVSLGADTTPPSWEASYPQVDTETTVGATARAQINEDGTAYYVVLANGASAPSPAQVQAGTDASDATALASGSIALNTGSEATDVFIGLALDTPYDVYFVAEDLVSNLQVSATLVEFTTLDDTNPPEWVVGWPKVDSLTTTATARAQINEDGTAYYVVLADGSTAPDSAEVKAGTGDGGATALASGSIVLTAGTEGTSPVSGLSLNTPYDVYFVAEDVMPNLQSSPVLVEFTTLADSITILNAGFESPDISPSGEVFAASPTSWTIVGTPGQTAIGIYDTASGSGLGVAGPNGGDQYIYLHSSGVFASVSQDTTLTWDSLTAGDTLTLSVYTNYYDPAAAAGFSIEAGEITLSVSGAGVGTYSSPSIDVSAVDTQGVWTLHTFGHVVTQADIDNADPGAVVNVAIRNDRTGSFTSRTMVDDVSLVHTPAGGGGEPFDDWATRDGASGVTFGGDANGDGVQDGMAFLLGADNPNVDAIGLLPTVSEVGGDLIMEFDCLASEDRGSSVLNLQYDGDLVAPWTSALVPGAVGPPTDVGNVYFETTANGDLIHIVATIDDDTEAADGRLFGRLQGVK